MQDKLIINHTFSQVIDEIDLNNVGEGSVLFSFNEYEPIVVILTSNDYKVEIECYSYYLEGQYMQCQNNSLLLTPNKEYRISNSATDDVSYIPSKYQILIRKNEYRINAFFEVKYNTQVRENELNFVIDKLNSFLDGLSIDFFRQNPINNIESLSNNSNYYLYELLYSYEKKLILCCENILSKLRNSIYSVYSKDKIEKKQNAHSVYLNNKNVDKRYFYNISKTPSNINVENILLKKYLLKIERILNDYNLDLDYLISCKTEKIKNLTNSLNEKTELLNTTNQSQANKKKIKYNIISINSIVEDCENWITKFSHWKNSYNKCLNAIKKVLISDEFINVDINNQIEYSPVFYTDYNYKFFYDFYRKISSLKGNKHCKNETNLFSDRRSYSIFEIYGFIILQNILKELGFVICEGINNIFNFESDCEFIFKNDAGQKIRLLYDHHCVRYNDSEGDEIVNVNSVNCKPDYILMFYDVYGKLQHSLIVEMKYRNLRYLIASSSGTTETDSTIDDYGQLKYKDPKFERLVNVIDEVILLFPRFQEKNFRRGTGLFIGININNDFDNSESYIKIKNIIESFI